MKRIFILLTVLFLSTKLWAQPNDPAGEQPFPGAYAPAFSVMDITGKMLKRYEMIGKVIVINFASLDSKRCKWQMEQLERAAKEVSPDSVVFISFFIEGGSKLRDFLKEKNITAINIAENAYPLHDRYQSDCSPTTIYVDKNGLVYSRFCSTIEYKEVMKQLNLALTKPYSEN